MLSELGNRELPFALLQQLNRRGVPNGTIFLLNQ